MRSIPLDDSPGRVAVQIDPGRAFLAGRQIRRSVAVEPKREPDGSWVDAEHLGDLVADADLQRLRPLERERCRKSVAQCCDEVLRGFRHFQDGSACGPLPPRDLAHADVGWENADTSGQITDAGQDRDAWGGLQENSDRSPMLRVYQSSLQCVDPRGQGSQGDIDRVMTTGAEPFVSLERQPQSRAVLTLPMRHFTCRSIPARASRVYFTCRSYTLLFFIDGKGVDLLPVRAGACGDNGKRFPITGYYMETALD